MNIFDLTPCVQISQRTISHDAVHQERTLHTLMQLLDICDTINQHGCDKPMYALINGDGQLSKFFATEGLHDFDFSEQNVTSNVNRGLVVNTFFGAIFDKIKDYFKNLELEKLAKDQKVILADFDRIFDSYKEFLSTFNPSTIKTMFDIDVTSILEYSDIKSRLKGYNAFLQWCQQLKFTEIKCTANGMWLQMSAQAKKAFPNKELYAKGDTFYTSPYAIKNITMLKSGWDDPVMIEALRPLTIDAINNYFGQINWHNATLDQFKKTVADYDKDKVAALKIQEVRDLIAATAMLLDISHYILPEAYCSYENVYICMSRVVTALQR